MCSVVCVCLFFVFSCLQSSVVSSCFLQFGVSSCCCVVLSSLLVAAVCCVYLCSMVSCVPSSWLLRLMFSGLFILVASISSLVYGAAFGVVSIYAAANSCKKAGYQNIDEIEHLEQLDKPGLATVCIIFWFVLVLLFRFGWLIFG